jgi:hypothetical protein
MRDCRAASTAIGRHGGAVKFVIHRLSLTRDGMAISILQFLMALKSSPDTVSELLGNIVHAAGFPFRRNSDGVAVIAGYCRVRCIRRVQERFRAATPFRTSRCGKGDPMRWRSNQRRTNP